MAQNLNCSQKANLVPAPIANLHLHLHLHLRIPSESPPRASSTSIFISVLYSSPPCLHLKGQGLDLLLRISRPVHFFTSPICVHIAGADFDLFIHPTILIDCEDAAGNRSYPESLNSDRTCLTCLQPSPQNASSFEKEIEPMSPAHSLRSTSFCATAPTRSVRC